jgi:hypothetical protein
VRKFTLAGRGGAQSRVIAIESSPDDRDRGMDGEAV